MMCFNRPAGSTTPPKLQRRCRARLRFESKDGSIENWQRKKGEIRRSCAGNGNTAGKKREAGRSGGPRFEQNLQEGKAKTPEVYGRK